MQAADRRQRGARYARFETFERRLALSAQPAADVFFGVDEQLEHHYGELAPALSDVHDTTGVSYARDTFGLTGEGQTVAIIDSGIAYDHEALGERDRLMQIAIAVACCVHQHKFRRSRGLVGPDRLA